MQPLKLKFLIFAIASMLSANTFADTYKCVGMDSKGKTVHVLFDEKTMTLNIDGSVLKIQAPTNNRKGFSTEDYELEDGTMAYDSMVVEGKSKIMLYQLQAKDDEEISRIELACE